MLKRFPVLVVRTIGISQIAAFLYLAFLTLGFGVGCGRIARIRECRTLGELVNGSLSTIETKARARTAVSYRSAAKDYTELAKKVRQMRFSGAPGGSALEEYALMLESAAPAAAAYALGLETKNRQQTQEAERGLELIRRQERVLVSRIDAYCHAP